MNEKQVWQEQPENTKKEKVMAAKAKAELTELLSQRTALSAKLYHLENQIYEMEGDYLSSTRNFGNVVTGWHNVLDVKKGDNSKKSNYIPIEDSDRIFSSSSTTSLAAVRNRQDAVSSCVKKDINLPSEWLTDVANHSRYSSSKPTKEELARLIAKAKTAGKLTGPPTGKLLAEDVKIELIEESCNSAMEIDDDEENRKIKNNDQIENMSTATTIEDDEDNFAGNFATLEILEKEEERVIEDMPIKIEPVESNSAKCTRSRRFY